MSMFYLKRAGLRAAVRAGAALNRPLRSNELTMDPVMSAIVRLANKRPTGASMELSALRARYLTGPSLTGLRPSPEVRVSAIEAAGRPARRYVPPGPISAQLLYFHGGGFIAGGLETHDALCRMLAARGRIGVVSVDYRLAPEHPFPAGYDDARSTWAWAQAQGGAWLIGGDSAGANLAAGQALDGSARLQVLIYPVVDLLQQHGRYPSIDEFWDGYILTAETMKACARLLIPAGQDAADVRLSPIRADLGRASPAMVITAGFDPLRDQGRAYVAALQSAGVHTHLVEERALPHGFADFAGVVPAARRAVERIADAIRMELAR